MWHAIYPCNLSGCLRFELFTLARSLVTRFGAVGNLHFATLSTWGWRLPLNFHDSFHPVISINLYSSSLHYTFHLSVAINNQKLSHFSHAIYMLTKVLNVCRKHLPRSSTFCHSFRYFLTTQPFSLVHILGGGEGKSRHMLVSTAWR